MSITLVAQLNAHIVGAVGNPADVESDSVTASRGTLNVNIDRTSPNSGFITVEPFFIPESTANLPAPAAPTLTSSAGGSISSIEYFFKISYVDVNGAESPLSAEANVTPSSDYVPVVDSPSAETDAVYYKVYGSNASDGGSGAETLQALVPVGTNWTMPTSGLVAGSAMPNQEASLADGACTVTITQGAGTLSITTAQ